MIMQLRLRLVLPACLAVIGLCCAQHTIPVSRTADAHITDLHLPALPPGDVLVRHQGFVLAYRERHEQASWVAYQLTREETDGPAERSNRFVADPTVPSGSATDEDYAGSGYDRGHLAPAGDMTWSPDVMQESFFYSNMSPQVPAFNRGIWKKLETLVRSWAAEAGALEIATGPILVENLPVIGPNGVSVPTHYYKVVLDYQLPGIRAAAFVLPNAPSSLSLDHFMVPIDSVEKWTGIDFFPLLPEQEEDLLERMTDRRAWDWHATSHAGAEARETDEAEPATEPASSVQCEANTKEGSRCRNRTTSPSGRCRLHQR